MGKKTVASVFKQGKTSLRNAGISVSNVPGLKREVRRRKRGDDVPVRKVKGGYKWGSSGKVYKRKSDAMKQARAAYASGGTKEKNVARKRKTRKKRSSTCKSKSSGI